MDSSKVYFIIAISGFIAGTCVGAGIAVLINLWKSGRYRRENGELRKTVELCSRTIEQYGIKVSAIRRDLETCQSELTRGLKDISSIRDASKAIRKQVEVLEKYVIDTGCIYGNLVRDFDTSFKKELAEE